MAIAFDDDLKPQACNAELRNFHKSGGRSATGREQRVFGDAGFWEISYRSMPMRARRDRVLAYRATIARLRQGEEIIAKVFDLFRCIGQGPASVVANASQRATTIMINGVDAELQPGHHFSIGYRLYRVTEIADQTETPIGVVTGTYTGDTWDDSDVWVDDPIITSTIKFLPPLRAAAVAGATVDFENLKCLCVLKDMSDGDLDLELGRFGSPSFTLIESF